MQCRNEERKRLLTMELTEKFMRDPLRILVKSQELTLEGIKNYFVFTGADERDKLPTLVDLYDQLSITAGPTSLTLLGILAAGLQLYRTAYTWHFTSILGGFLESRRKFEEMAKR